MQCKNVGRFSNFIIAFGIFRLENGTQYVASFLPAMRRPQGAMAVTAGRSDGRGFIRHGLPASRHQGVEVFNDFTGIDVDNVGHAVSAELSLFLSQVAVGVDVKHGTGPLKVMG